MRDDGERLLDILDAIRQIEKYAVRGFDAFSQNELIQAWFTRHLQIIGEAAPLPVGEGPAPEDQQPDLL